MNWKQIFNKYSSNIIEFKKLHSSYEFALQQTNQQIRVNVWENNNGTFTGWANYSIQNQSQAIPYRSITQQKTPEDALDDAINGILTYYQPPYNQIKFISEQYY